ncbi:MAG: carboxypeptidase regulatory-like domain-containing protein, partial [Rhodothermales bacterium]|nr:carboxypeptidase regulatory-like domain-containing protein [Rhodothermales bacterium]
LPGANVVLRAGDAAPLGAVSDKNGFYQLSEVPAGRYAVRVSFIGYEAFADTLRFGDRPLVRLNVALAPAEEVLGEIVVGAEGGAAKVQAGLQTIRPADLARIPTPDVSGDLATYLQSLPGVVALGDRGGQLFIRGGTPAQNLVLLDGMLIYQPFHVVGFFSAFPEDLVASADLYAGGFGARYSGRLSSVIDVLMREGNNRRFEGAATLSPFLTGVRVEGPLKKGGRSMLVSLRQSVVERIAAPLIDDDLPFRFGDAFVKLSSGGADNSRCSASGTRTYDRGRIAPPESPRDDVFRWSNLVFGGRCVAFPAAAPFLLEVSASVSNVRNEVGDAADPERASWATRTGVDVHLARNGRRTAVRGGFFTRMTWLGYRLEEQFQNLAREEQTVLRGGGYLEAEVALRPTLRLTPGLSVTLYADYPATFEPRLRAVWQPFGVDGPTELSAAAGLYRQTVAGLSDERDAGSVFVAWVPAPLGGSAEQAVHVLGGWQQQLGRRVRFSAEGYYKRLANLTVPIWSTVARFTTTLTRADGDVYGADARLEYQRRRFYAYVGYSLARTRYRAGGAPFGVFFGEPITGYAPPHDRRHQLNAVASVEVAGVTASLRWQYGSGLPFTPVRGFDEVLPVRALADVREAFGTTRVLYEPPYRARLPPYHRLDLALERTFRAGPMALTLQGGVINTYDRANLFYFDLFTVQRVDQLPLIPNLAIKLETR